MRWLINRVSEPSTWSGLSHLLVVLALLLFSYSPNWHLFVWAAAVTAVVAIVLKEKAS